MDGKTRTISKLDSTSINCSFMGLCTYLAKPDTQTAPSLEQQCPQNPACSSVGGKPSGQLGSLSLTWQAPLQDSGDGCRTKWTSLLHLTTKEGKETSKPCWGLWGQWNLSCCLLHTRRCEGQLHLGRTSFWGSQAEAVSTGRDRLSGGGWVWASPTSCSQDKAMRAR